MTLRDVLEHTKAIIGEKINLDEQGEQKDKLLAAALSIYDELTTDYVHLKAEEEVVFEGGVAYFADFEKNVKDILSIKQAGKNISFEMFPLFVKNANITGTVEIKYYYKPDEPELDSLLELPPRFSVYMLANGVASEYYYRSGMVDEATYYRNRYEYSLSNAQVRLRNLTLKAEKLLC